MYVLKNLFFQNLMRQFFFNIDKIVFGLISRLYDLLLVIARTSPLSQGDIASMADRIYKLLAIFMIFKVTFSLIMYVVNPDDFTEKSKGVTSLLKNIVLSMALLILTPFIFRYAYRLQEIVLEDNSLAALVFGEEKVKNGFFNSAGEDMAFVALSPFFVPDTSIDQLYNCTTLLENGKFRSQCSGLQGAENNYQPVTDTSVDTSNTMYALTKDNSNFTETDLKNYVTGMENSSMGLTFRLDLALATVKGEDRYVMDYSYFISTVVGVVIALLLVSFCMDIGVRSIKLAFLQLIAPIPIISYVDPKSGKDGLFKKWYKMCLSTFASLFVRLLVIYFAVYIISKVTNHKLVDVIDGSYVTGTWVSLFIMIGALMFAKQFPKILENLGIKLDGGGKFTLNPLKKMEEEALGGKRITGAVGGMVAGIPRGQIISGATRGFFNNAGLRGGFQKQADVNRKIGEARMNGASRFKSYFAGAAYAFGMENVGLENKFRRLNKEKHDIELAERNLNSKIQPLQNRKKDLENIIAEDAFELKSYQNVSKAGKALVDFSKTEISGGKAGSVSTNSKNLKNIADYLNTHQNERAKRDIAYHYVENGVMKKGIIKKGDYITTSLASAAQNASGIYDGKIGAIEHLEVRLQGMQGMKPKWESIADPDTGFIDFERDASGNIVFEKMTDAEKTKYDEEHADFMAENRSYEETATANGAKVLKTAKEIKNQSDEYDTKAKIIDAGHADERAKIDSLDAQISEINNKEKIIYRGKEMSIAEAKRLITEEEKTLTDERTSRKTDVEYNNARRIGRGGK